MSLFARPRQLLARRAQGRAAPGDSGFMMIYVMMIITIVSVLVSGTLVVTASNIVPSVRSVYDQAAQSAAEAGLNAFVAYANTNCASGSTSTVATCTLPSNISGVNPTSIFTSSGYASSYIWFAAKDPQGRYFRVTSTGTVSDGGLKAGRTLIADVSAGASSNPLNFGVITGFETESPTDILAHYPQREIAFDATGVANATVPIKNNSVTWSGGSPGTAAGKVAVCNATINQKGGRGNNPPPKAPNPYVDWTEDTIQGNHYTNFEPCQTSWGHLSELLAPANPADGPGGYFAADAMLLSNSYPGGTGPLFDQPVTTAYSYIAADSGVCGTAPGQNYRSFNLICAGYPLEVGGSPSPRSTYGSPQIGSPPNINSGAITIPIGACLYAGPTRVKLNGDGTATVTSPQTTSSWVGTGAVGHPAQCYSGAGAGGMVTQTVSLSGISVISVQNHGTPPPVTPALAHGSSGWDTTGQHHGATASTSNSVFYLTSGTAGTTAATAYTGTAPDKPYTPAVGDNPSTKSTDVSWTPQWTSFSSGTTCSTSTAATDLKFYNCHQSGGTYSATAYSTLKSTVQAALAANPSSYNAAATLQSYLTSVLAAGNSSDANNSAPTNHDNTSHRWQVSVTQDASATDGCNPSASSSGPANTSINPPTSDPFYASVNGNTAISTSTATTCLTATVTLQVPTCSVLNLLVCIGSWVWGNGTAVVGGGLSVPQLKVTTTNVATTTTTTITPAVSSFPSMDDVTQYSLGSGGALSTSADGPGDLYVEGTNPTTLAMQAQDDVIVTGTLAPTNSLVDAQTPVMKPTAALEVIGQNNVRVYHPVKCVVTTAALIDPSATSPGFCPDDITGLYTGVPANGARPDQQYTNMRPDLANLTINAVVFALGNAPQSITCPQPPGGGGVCGGEFVVDNYNRGDSVGTSPLGYVTVIGTLEMAHHAPVGQEWQIPDTSGQASRPYSGYQLAVRYQNVISLLSANSSVSGLIPAGPNTPTPWHIISTSIGTA